MSTRKAPKPQVKAAIYTRISLDRSGEKLGVERQMDDCTKLADHLGWEIVAHYDDNDLSAYSGKTRPGFEALLDAMKRDEIDALLCWHPDRLYRSLKDLVRLLEVAGTTLIRTVNGGDLDLSTATGKMLATILGSVQINESEHKAERQRRAARQKAEKGKPQWKRAFGYTATPEGPVPDPAVAPLVGEAYRLILQGASLGEVCRLFNGAGAHGLTGKPWTASTASLFLRAPRNAGLRSHTDTATGQTEIVGKGTWAPLVDEDTWRAAQAVLEAPARRPGRKTVRRHLLTGVLQCGREGCDGHLGGYQVTGTGARAYRCWKCLRVSIRADQVEPLLRGIVAARLARPDAVDLLRASDADNAEAEKVRQDAAALRARLATLADDYAEGLLTGQQVKQATDRINGQLAVLERQQQDAERVRVFDGLPLGETDVAATVDELSPDRLRAVLDVLLVATVLPVGKGHRAAADGQRFDPDRVQITWK